MPDHRRQSDAGDRSGWIRFAVVGLIAVGLAVAVNYVAMPSLARQIFARTPVRHIVDFDEKRKEVTRQVSAAIIAGMLGPAESAPPEESPAADGPEPSTAPPSQKPPEASAGRPDRRPASEESANEEERETAPEEESDGEARATSEPEAPAVPDETSEYRVDRRELDRRLRHPERVRDKVSVVSERGPDGQYRGLRIVEVVGWFGEFGLRPGDVIRKINGFQVTTRQQAVSMLMGMKRETTFTFDVERHDNEFQIRYQIPHVETR